jgi:hypothetical protein
MVLANTLLPEAVSPHERIPLRLEMIEAGILQSLEDVREQYEQVHTHAKYKFTCVPMYNSELRLSIVCARQQC